MSKNLVIVESPAKAKTIERFLGDGFIVKSSIGHIRDMPKKGMGIDIDNDFTPTYEVSADKKKIVSELKKTVKTVERVWLATDEDREGEAIAWHLAKALNLPEDTPRIVFNEITKSAIGHAIKTPRIIDKNLVDAQQARRILDRLVGFELSPVLWRKVSGAKSAGRVQSPVVRLVVEREREIKNFKSQSFFSVSANLKTAHGQLLAVKLDKTYDEIESANDFVKAALSAKLTVASVITKPAKRSPAPPFITSTLQQEAAQKLGFSVKQTMSLAQNLYRNGWITYMRTDSFHLSAESTAQAKQVITAKFGADYAQTRHYQTKNSSAQEAHEAIRPTDLSKANSSGGDERENKLYQLIYSRMLASQMSDAKLQKTTARIDISGRDELWVAQGEVLIFAGFLKAHQWVENDDNLLPVLAEKETLTLLDLLAKETFSKAKPRYSEASLVKKIEQMGIGRPSTFATMVSTVQDRGYVIKQNKEGTPRQARVITIENGQINSSEQTETTGTEKNKLMPTDLAYLLSDFLVKHFDNIVDYDFTAKLESQFDAIAKDKKKWQSMIKIFYADFKPKINAALALTREQVSQSRELGIDPKTKRPVSVRLGRYGAFAQLGLKTDETPPVFASLKKQQNLDDIDLEAALALFELPRLLGKNDLGEDIKANYGRFGPYVQYGKKYVSLKDEIPEEVTLEHALILIAEKEKMERERIIKTFENSDIQVLNGRFGPYIYNGLTGKGRKNVTVKKIFGDLEPKQLTLQQCQDAIDGKIKAKKTTKPRKKALKKSAKKS